MSASTSELWRPASLALLLVAVGCGDPAQYRYGTNLSGLLFAPVSPTEGVYPSTAVLRDPNNPFAANAPNLRQQPDGGVGTKWQLLASVGGVPAFYAFATALTQEPSGENQYYTAQMLAEVAASGAVADGVNPDDVRALAIAGYQAVFDSFPNSISYFADGKKFFTLDLVSYRGAAALGGQIRGWTLVTTPDGGAAVVRNSQYVNVLDGGN